MKCEQHKFKYEGHIEKENKGFRTVEKTYRYVYVCEKCPYVVHVLPILERPEAQR